MLLIFCEFKKWILWIDFIWWEVLRGEVFNDWRLKSFVQTFPMKTLDNRNKIALPHNIMFISSSNFFIYNVVINIMLNVINIKIFIKIWTVNCTSEKVNYRKYKYRIVYLIRSFFWRFINGLYFKKFIVCMSPHTINTFVSK